MSKVSYVCTLISLWGIINLLFICRIKVFITHPTNTMNIKYNPWYHLECQLMMVSGINWFRILQVIVHFAYFENTYSASFHHFVWPLTISLLIIKFNINFSSHLYHSFICWLALVCWHQVAICQQSQSWSHPQIN